MLCDIQISSEATASGGGNHNISSGGGVHADSDR